MTDRVLNTHTTPAAPFLLDPHGGLWRLTRNDRDVRYQRAGGGEGWAWTLADLESDFGVLAALAPVAQEPTEAEVEAAADAINAVDIGQMSHREIRLAFARAALIAGRRSS